MQQSPDQEEYIQPADKDALEGYNRLEARLSGPR